MSDSPGLPSWMQDKPEGALAQGGEPAPPPQEAPPAPPEPVGPPRELPTKLRRGPLATIVGKIWEERKAGLADWKPSRRSRVGLRNLSIYTRQLGLMLNGGLSLIKCFEILGTQGEDRLLREASLAVKDDLLKGQSLAQAFAAHPDIYPSFMNFTVQSAEASGTLPRSLLRMASYYEKENERFQKVKASLVYPAFVFSFATIMFFAIVGYIFPLFEQFFAGLNFQLPPITRFLFAVFGLFTNKWFWIVVASLVIVAYFFLNAALKKPMFVLRLNIYQIQFPIFGKLMRKVTASHMCRALSTMLESGVFLIAAFQILRKGSTAPIFRIMFYLMEENVRIGKTLADTFLETGLFPRVVEDMVLIGEESGKLQVMLEKSSDYLDLEIEMLLQNLTALIEPILIVCLGFMVGAILIGLFLPLYSAIGQIH